MISLDDIRIASPCSSDWDQMYGDERRRFCAECKLNVYNLSGMTRDEAEQLVMNSEGRLCVRFYRRKDGTILTQDCPVGWKAVKKRAARVAVALSSILAGFFAGAFSLKALDAGISMLPTGEVEEPKTRMTSVGIMVDATELRGRVSLPEIGDVGPRVGRVQPVERFQDVKVKAWVK